MLQRASLATLMLKNPPILALDEPFTGLDPASCSRVEEWVRERTRLGATVLLVTHDLERIGRMCHRVLLLRSGRAISVTASVPDGAVLARGQG
jgi:ABC-type multidrug transport system ATPase subunit